MSGMIQSQKTDFDIKSNIGDAFDACVAAADSIGKIQQQNKKLNIISVKTGRTWAPPCNPVSLNISLREKDTDTCNITIDAQSVDGLVGVGSCGKVITMFTDALSERI